MEYKVIAVDFDGVIHDYKNPIEGRRMGGEIFGTKDALKRIRAKGYKIVVFSVWGAESKTITDFMKYYNLPFDEVTNIKPLADYYIDDKAIRFTNWEDALNQI